jgi:hypothetical protein
VVLLVNATVVGATTPPELGGIEPSMGTALLVGEVEAPGGGGVEQLARIATSARI